MSSSGIRLPSYGKIVRTDIQDIERHEEVASAMAKRYIYSFDHADEYEDIAPCKFCGSRPYSNMAGISCHACGYEVARFGMTNEQVVVEWNANPTDGTERAEPVCAITVIET